MGGFSGPVGPRRGRNGLLVRLGIGGSMARGAVGGIGRRASGNGDLGADGVGDEALFVGLVVEVLCFFGGGVFGG